MSKKLEAFLQYHDRRKLSQTVGTVPIDTIYPQNMNGISLFHSPGAAVTYVLYHLSLHSKINQRQDCISSPILLVSDSTLEILV